MADSTYCFGQMVEVMETGIVASKGRHILRPRRKDKQRAMCAGFEATALGFPIAANGVSLHMNHSQFLFPENSQPVSSVSCHSTPDFRYFHRQ